MSDTLVSAWGAARDRLRAAGVESPVFDARLLVEAGAGVQRLDIITDPRRELSAAQVQTIEDMVARRVRREPLSHILGKRAFWTLELVVTPAVLTPRPETELLVQLALEVLAKDEPARVLDLGVGSGAILLSVLAEHPRAHGVGLDLSGDALAVAGANAETLGLAAQAEFHHGGWDAELGEPFDLVLSNPPYIPSGDIAGLEPEIQFEPRLALDGGADGLEAYRAIAPRLRQLLRPGGVFGLEVGAGQAEAVNALLTEAGLSPNEPRRDLAGIARMVWGKTPE